MAAASFFLFVPNPFCVPFCLLLDGVVCLAFDAVVLVVVVVLIVDDVFGGVTSFVGVAEASSDESGMDFLSRGLARVVVVMVVVMEVATELVFLPSPSDGGEL